MAASQNGGKHFQQNLINVVMCSGDFKGNDCRKAIGWSWVCPFWSFIEKCRYCSKSRNQVSGVKKWGRKRKRLQSMADWAVGQKRDPSVGQRGESGVKEGWMCLRKYEKSESCMKSESVMLCLSAKACIHSSFFFYKLAYNSICFPCSVL